MTPEDEAYFRSIRTHPIPRAQGDMRMIMCPVSVGRPVTPDGKAGNVCSAGGKKDCAFFRGTWCAFDR